MSFFFFRDPDPETQLSPYPTGFGAGSKYRYYLPRYWHLYITLYVNTPDVDKVAREEHLRLVDKLLDLVLGEEELTPLEHEARVEHLLRLVLGEGEEGVLGPPQGPHDDGKLEASVVVVGRQPHHLLEGLLGVLQPGGSLQAALWNRNYFLRFRFRLLKSYGSGSGSNL